MTHGNIDHKSACLQHNYGSNNVKHSTWAVAHVTSAANAQLTMLGLCGVVKQASAAQHLGCDIHDICCKQRAHRVVLGLCRVVKQVCEAQHLGCDIRHICCKWHPTLDVQHVVCSHGHWHAQKLEDLPHPAFSSILIRLNPMWLRIMGWLYLLCLALLSRFDNHELTDREL